MNGVLLDTCAVIWSGNGDPMDAPAVEAIQDAFSSGQMLGVSPITAWELGLLVSRNRLRLTQEAHNWFRNFLDRSGCTLSALDPDLLIASSFLPGEAPKDPADRIIIATARSLDLTIVTRDGLILSYAEQGHVQAIRC